MQPKLMARAKGSGLVDASAFPTLRSPVILGLGGNPLGALGSGFLFPEGGFGFQPINEEMAGLESRLPVRGRSDDEHDVIARFQLAITVDDQASASIAASAFSVMPG